MGLRKIIVGAALCLALFVAAVPAYAQSAAQNGYSEPAGSVQQQLGGGGDEHHHAQVSNIAKHSGGGGGTTASSDSKLPFTGLDIALVVAAGGVLLAMGLGIRRLSRTEVA